MGARCAVTDAWLLSTDAFSLRDSENDVQLLWHAAIELTGWMKAVVMRLATPASGTMPVLVARLRRTERDKSANLSASTRHLAANGERWERVPQALPDRETSVGLKDGQSWRDLEPPGPTRVLLRVDVATKAVRVDVVPRVRLEVEDVHMAAIVANAADKEQKRSAHSAHAAVRTRELSRRDGRRVARVFRGVPQLHMGHYFKYRDAFYQPALPSSWHFAFGQMKNKLHLLPARGSVLGRLMNRSVVLAS